MKDVSEILSKYNRKKKYYKLKNVVFISSNPENLKELLDLKDALFLSNADIAKGIIYLPKYRALYINQFGALLADDMGLGKTIQLISMLGNWKDRKKTLIVCPASLVYNWNAEIEKFMPSLPHKLVLGTGEECKNIILHARDNEILLTSYHLLKHDVAFNEGVAFDCEVIDEAQNIKNPLTMTAKSVKLIDAKYRVALTGTPIENTLSELWSVFDYRMPVFLARINLFENNLSFRL